MINANKAVKSLNTNYTFNVEIILISAAIQVLFSPNLVKFTTLAMAPGPNYGRRLLPVELDRIAEESPSRVFASVPITSNVNDGFRDVSFRDIANGVNGFAHFLENRYGRGNNFETLSYIGMPDLRYVIVVLGAMKCGYKVSMHCYFTPIVARICGQILEKN